MSSDSITKYRRFSPKWILFSPKWIPCFGKLLLLTYHQSCRQHSKFKDHQTASSKVMAKNLTFCRVKIHFSAIIFELVVRLSPNFEGEKIYSNYDLLARAVCRKQVIHLGNKRSTWGRMSSRIPSKNRISWYACCTIFSMHDGSIDPVTKETWLPSLDEKKYLKGMAFLSGSLVSQRLTKKNKRENLRRCSQNA